MRFPLASPALSILLFILASCAGTDRSFHDGKRAFLEFLGEYSMAPTAETKQTVLNAFWSNAISQPMPLFDLNRTDVIFVYRDDTARTVELVGDMTGWKERIPFNRLEESDFFYLRASYPADGRFDYRFVIDGERQIQDPGNQRAVQTGFGVNSELAMPQFVPAPELTETPEVPVGMLATFMLASTVLGYDRVVHVYLPPGYDASGQRYPVVYFLDGNDYIFFGNARTILNNLIEGEAIPPTIGVFIVPPAHPERNRITEYSLNDAFVQHVITELVPHIDATYRTIPDPRQRAIVGASRGGLMSLYLAFRHPEMFGTAASQSGNVSCNDDRLISLFQRSETKDLVIYHDVGLYEEAITVTNGDDVNFLRGNRMLRDVLAAKRYKFTYREFPDGHSWGRWRNELPYILRLFLGVQ